MLSSQELLEMMQIALHGSIPTATLQTVGSGASIPEHAHLAFSSESLPIVEVSRIEVQSSAGWTASKLQGLPHLAIVYSGEPIEVVRMVVSGIVNLRDFGLSYNLLILNGEELVLIPRTAEVSPHLGRKVGVSVVSGIYPAYLSANPGELTPLQAYDLIQEHWATVTAQDLLTAVEQTTLSPKSSWRRMLGLEPVEAGR